MLPDGSHALLGTWEVTFGLVVGKDVVESVTSQLSSDSRLARSDDR